MRVVLCGSHGTGKSTILQALKEKLPGYFYQTESITRLAVPDSSKVNFGADRETQTRIMAKWEEIINTSPANYVTARHCLDYLAYTIYFAKINDTITGEFIRSQFDIVEKYKKYFDLVFYVPIEFEQKQGGDFRQGQLEHPDYQRDHDLIIKFLLWTFDVEYKMITGTVEERVSRIMEAIRSREKNGT